MELKELQNEIRKLYLEKDLRQGIKAAFNHLQEEVDELKRALDNNDKKNIAEELADVFAFILTIANMYNIDLETAFIEKVLKTKKGIV